MRREKFEEIKELLGVVSDAELVELRNQIEGEVHYRIAHYDLEVRNAEEKLDVLKEGRELLRYVTGGDKRESPEAIAEDSGEEKDEEKSAEGVEKVDLLAALEEVEGQKLGLKKIVERLKKAGMESTRSYRESGLIEFVREIGFSEVLTYCEIVSELKELGVVTGRNGWYRLKGE